MQIKHLCVLIHIWTKGGVRAVKRFKPSSKIFYWPFHGSTSFVDHLCYVLCLSCFPVCSLLPCGHLLGKGWPLGFCLWCLIAFLSLSHVVSWVRYLIVSIPDLAAFLTLPRPWLNSRGWNFSILPGQAHDGLFFSHFSKVFLEHKN